MYTIQLSQKLHLLYTLVYKQQDINQRKENLCIGKSVSTVDTFFGGLNFSPILTSTPCSE